MTKNLQILYMTLASACSALAVCLLIWLIAPKFTTAIVGADAVSIANTYIVLTTLLVTLFAAFVAVVTFFSSQNSAEMKMLKLQQEFEEHLTSNDGFARKMISIAEKHVSSQLTNAQNKQTLQQIVDLVVKGASAEVEKDAMFAKGLKDIQAEAAKNGEQK